MLNTVEVYTTRGEMLSLPLQDTSSGFLIKEIEGLEPVKASLVSSSFAQMDGETFLTASVGTRNVIIKMGLEPDYEETGIRALRLRLYRYFMPKSEVRLVFYMDGDTPVEIMGRVEDVSTDLFVREPEVSITLLCFDPYFYSTMSNTFYGETVEDDTYMDVEYEGSVEAGFLFRLSVDRTMTELSLSNSPGGFQQTLDFLEPLIPGDVLEISTVPGAKRATRIRDGVQKSILYGVSPSAAWVQLFPGNNRIRALLDGDPMSYSITYKAKYGGL